MGVWIVIQRAKRWENCKCQLGLRRQYRRNCLSFARFIKKTKQGKRIFSGFHSIAGCVITDSTMKIFWQKKPAAQNYSKKGERDEIKTKTEISSLTLHQGLHNSLFVGGPAGRLSSLLVFEEILKLGITSMSRSWQWILCSLDCTWMINTGETIT